MNKKTILILGGITLIIVMITGIVFIFSPNINIFGVKPTYRIPIISALTEVFYEDWEAGIGADWSNTRWEIAVDYDGNTGNSVLCPLNGDCNISSVVSIDTSSYSDVNVSFIYNDDDCDAADLITWYWKDDTGNWDLIGSTIDAGTLGQADDAWFYHSALSSDSQYLHAGFAVRFFGGPGNNENYWFDDLNVSGTLGAADSVNPNVSLESPANSTINTTDNTPDIVFNVSDETNITMNCTLWMNNGTLLPYGYNASVVNATSTTMTVNSTLQDDEYFWYVNCSDGTNTGQSEVRNITIDIPTHQTFSDTYDQWGPITLSTSPEAGDDLVLYVFLSARGDVSNLAMTWDGDSLTQLTNSPIISGVSHLGIWRLIAPNADGTSKDLVITITYSASNRRPTVVGMFFVKDVNQTTPDDGFVSNSSDSAIQVININSAIGDLVLGAVSNYGESETDAYTTDQGQIEEWNLERYNTDSNNEMSAGSSKAGASIINLNWTSTTTQPWVAAGININSIGDQTPPNISLESPANNTVNQTDNTPDVIFNVSDETNLTTNCTLWMNNGTLLPYGYNATVQNATGTTMTVNSTLQNDEYFWYVNCSDGINTGQSEVRNLTIDIAAFPEIVTSSTSSEGSDVTSHIVDMPSGVSEGDLLIVFFSADSSMGTATITWEDGWTQIFKVENDPGSNDQSTGAMYKIANASEESSATITTNQAETSAHQAFRITGHDPSTPPEAGVVANGESTSPNPPSLSPTWGAENTLWFATMSKNVGSNVAVTDYPSDYTNGAVVDSNPAAGSASIATARRELSADPEDPGVFTIDTLDGWFANTVAVKPAEAEGDCWFDESWGSLIPNGCIRQTTGVTQIG